MKAILSFNLPEEQQEHKDCMDGARLRIVLQELCQVIRSYDKYDSTSNMHHELVEAIKTHPEGARDILDGLRATLFQIMDDNDVRLWE